MMDNREGGTQDRPFGKQEQLERLIKQALSQPGLAAMMKVYRSSWFKSGTFQSPQLRLPTGKVTVSTSSLPPGS